MKSEVTSLFRSRFGRSLFCASMGLLLASLAGAFQLDPKIANSWADYHYGQIDKRMVQINLPKEYGATMLFLSNRDGTLVRLEDHVANWHFDDIGYMFFAQLAVFWLGELTAAQLAWWHNAMFIFSSIALAAAICHFRRSIALGMIVLVLLVALRVRLQPQIYSSVSQHTLVTILPLAFIAFLVPLFFLIRSKGLWVAFSWAVLVGSLAGAIDLIRHSVGIACMAAIAGAIVLSRCSWKRLLATLSGAVIGVILISVVFPGVMAIHRDVRLGWYRGFSLKYLKRPPTHKPYFTLLAAIGRYPNSLGVRYHDRSIDDYLASLYPGVNYAKVFDDLARKEYLEFVRRHPLEYLRYVVRGFSELPLVIPVITFNREFIWGGTPLIPSDVEALVEDYDRQPANINRLHNIRFRYLRLTPWEWLVYGSAVFLTLGVVIFSGWGLITGMEENAVFWSAFIFLVFLAIPRGLIPVHGHDFVAAFWVVAVLALVEAWRTMAARFTRLRADPCGRFSVPAAE
jgi:hypothetical protein